MRKGRSTGKPTTEQVARFEAIHHFGCIACRMRGLTTPAEIHHLTIGGRHGQKRRGHDFSVGLCPWHHRGEPMFALSHILCECRFGPSYAREPRRFREVFGQDDELLARQNCLIEGDDRFTEAA